MNKENIENLKNSFYNYRDKDLYSYQNNEINNIISSENKIYICEAPTGSGKSLIGSCVLAYYKSGIYIVHSKILQTQILTDFPEYKTMYGRNNYPCIKSKMENDDDTKTAEDCTKDFGCAWKHKCEYKIKKKEFLLNDYKCTNYHYYFYEANYAGTLKNENIVIIDEADNLEKMLSNFMSISFNKKMIKYFNLPFPKYKTSQAEFGVESWKIWAKEVSCILEQEKDRLGKLLNKVKTFHEEDYEDLNKYNKIKLLLFRLDIFVKYVDKTWLFDHKPEKWEFKPLWVVPELADLFLWSHSNKFLLMSATFDTTKILCKKLGLDIEQTYRPSKPIPCTFPVESRKIIVNPVANLIYKSMDEEIPKLVEEIKNIIDNHYNEKGIIHTVSYNLAKKIKEIKSDRLLIHDSKDKNNVLEHFLNSHEPLILISPVLDRGVNLEGIKSRFGILCKAPFLSLKDKMVSQRVYSSKIGQEWYISDMLMTVVQMTGRIVRKKHDWGINYILDKQIEKHIINNSKMLQKWWLNAVEFISKEEW